MTIEEITQTLQTVAENQVRADEAQARHEANMAKLEEAHARHVADVTDIDKMIAANVESLNRHDRQLDRLFEVVGDLADKQLKNEGLFAENEKRFADLAEAQRRADFRMERLEGSYELLESFVRDFREETRDHFAETDKRLADLAVAQATTDGQIKALIAAQTRTDGQIRSLLERNGSSKAKTKKPGAKKAAKKKGAK